ncbi:hypothetical protein OSB04_010522 [Centaurea solstitialis]|uniref:Uncharacterized protein n=1 Tax=Centaurea solstitialis TaxID=347529 RepID=A0AA38TSK2_9ASTR|nr:hypothetical protein OSB04_010522 [Centaurea solstitialis]
MASSLTNCGNWEPRHDLQIMEYKEGVRSRWWCSREDGRHQKHKVQRRWSAHGDGRANDFVHTYDTESNYESGQEIEVFGEIGWISFSPDAEAMFVGISDRMYGGVLEFSTEDIIIDTWTPYFSIDNSYIRPEMKYLGSIRASG